MFYKRSPWYTHLHGADTSLQLQFLAQKGGMMGRHSKFDRDEPSWYLSESDNGFERTWRSKALDLVVLIGFQSLSHLFNESTPIQVVPLPPSQLQLLSWDCSWWSLPFSRSCVGHFFGGRLGSYLDISAKPRSFFRWVYSRSTIGNQIHILYTYYIYRLYIHDTYTCYMYIWCIHVIYT